MKTDRAFTLTELLTLIAVVGLMAAIQIPLFQLARESVDNARCQSNLRQWHAALLAHADDNNDNLVAVRSSQPENRNQFWSGNLAYYLDLEAPEWGRQAPTIHGTAAECPSVPWRDFSTYISYGASGGDFNALPFWDTVAPRSIHSVAPRTIVFGDTGETYETRSFTLRRTAPGNAGAPAYRHRNHANVVMMGGSVESFHIDDDLANQDDLWRYDR